MAEEITSKVKELLASSVSKEDIYKNLLAEGYSISEIESGFLPDEAVVQEEEKHNTQKNTINTVLTIAAILVGIGIFSFVASNWREMSRFMKILLILVSMTFSYGYGWYYYEKKEMKRMGSALMLLGGLIYGAGIFLIGQMFNIRASWPDGFILWMLGVLAIAYASNIFKLYNLAIILGFIAVVVYPFINFANVFSSTRPFLFTSSALLLVSFVVTFYLAVKFQKT